MTDPSNERTRITTILANEHARRFPSLAQALAFESSIDADGAIAVLTAASIDFNRLGGETTSPPTQRRRVTQSGLAMPETTERRSGGGAGNWSKAVATANRAVDSIVGESERKSPGWGKAVSNANRQAG